MSPDYSHVQPRLGITRGHAAWFYLILLIPGSLLYTVVVEVGERREISGVWFLEHPEIHLLQLLHRVGQSRTT